MLQGDGSEERAAASASGAAAREPAAPPSSSGVMTPPPKTVFQRAASPPSAAAKQAYREMALGCVQSNGHADGIKGMPEEDLGASVALFSHYDVDQDGASGLRAKHCRLKRLDSEGNCAPGKASRGPRPRQCGGCFKSSLGAAAAIGPCVRATRVRA